jgi:tRNA 2-thiouridine synthesizing protein E
MWSFAGRQYAAPLRRLKTSQKPGGKKPMAYEFEGRTIESTATGYLANRDDWSKELAEHIAGLEQLTLTQRHWDLIDYLRDEYFNNNENSPNTRTILKAMSEKWGEKIDQKTLYDLFPLDPSKQGGRIAGLPESRRKGGY